MRKIIRDYRKLIAAEGLECREISINGGGHYVIATDCGELFAPSTPSSNANFRHVRAQLRRMAAR